MMKRYSFLAIHLLLLATFAACAGGRASRSDFSALERNEAPPTPLQKEIVRTARSLLGVPYRYGGTTPAGFDCSGFVDYVYRKAAGTALPRTADQLSRSGDSITLEELRPADLVYFKIEHQNDLHMGIYIGKGKFIHAPSAKGKVNIQRLAADYWRERYLGARRII